jgi:tetratricopeptide (TPR) repeat protein
MRDAATDAGSAPTGESSPAVEVVPVGAPALPVDRWIARATWLLVVAVLVVGAYLGWTYYSDQRLAATQSPAARAVANLQSAVASAPNDAMSHVRLAEAMVANGQEAAGVLELQVALKLDKNNASALVDLGLIAMDHREWSTAEADWNRLVGLLKGAQMATKDQRLADVYYYLGTTLVEEKRYPQALSALKSSIAISGDASPVHYMLSVAYQREGMVPQQKSELQTVLAFDPKEAQANYDLAMITLADGDVGQAAELLRVSADNAPSTITAPKLELAKLGAAPVRLAAATREQASDPAKALVDARVAAALDPRDAAAVELVARLWETQKDPARALNAWRRYLELVPGDPTAVSAVARLAPHAN